MYIFFKPVPHIAKLVFNDESYILSKYIKNTNLFDNSNLIITQFGYYSIIPYFKNSKNIKVINYCSGEIANHDTTVFARSKYCYLDNSYKWDYDYNQFDKIYDPKRKNILFDIKTKLPFYICKDDKKCYLFKPFKVSNKHYIHFMTKDDNFKH